jgi:hypothetical protein
MLDYKPGVPTFAPRHNGKLQTLISTCGLIDPLARHYSSRPFPASHIRGSAWIDYILVTPRLFSAASASGSLSYHMLFHGDHRAYYIDFTATELFSDPAYEIAPAIHQRL